MALKISKPTASQPTQPRAPVKAPAPRPQPVAAKFNDAFSSGRAEALRAKTLSGAPIRAKEPAQTGSTTVASTVSATSTPNQVSLTANGGFTSELTNSKGYGVSFGVSVDASVVANRQTENGITTYTVETDASVSVTGGASSPQAGVTVGRTDGLHASYSVAMPEAAALTTNPASVNPFDPMSMPTGTVITMDGSSYSTSEFNATFRNLALATKVTDSEGVSVAIEKTGETTVRVTAGPTEAIEAYNGVGVDFGVASAMLGRNDSLESATLRTAEFDLSTPEGLAAFNHFVATGTLPEANGTGVFNVATIEKIDVSSQTELAVSLGPIDLKLEGAQNTGNLVRTTLPDGTSEVSVDLQYEGNVEMNVTRHFDAEGNEILADRRYSYTVEADDSNYQLLNVALTGDVNQAQSGPVQPNTTVTITFTEEQMTQYMEMTQSASEAGARSLDPLVRDYDGAFIGSPQDFALSLGRNLGGSDYGQADRMFQVSDLGNGEYDNEYEAIPASVTVQPRPG